MKTGNRLLGLVTASFFPPNKLFAIKTSFKFFTFVKLTRLIDFSLSNCSQLIDFNPSFDHLTKSSLIKTKRSFYFPQVQNTAGIRQDLAFIHFQRNIIYSKGSSH